MLAALLVPPLSAWDVGFNTHCPLSFRIVKLLETKSKHGRHCEFRLECDNERYFAGRSDEVFVSFFGAFSSSQSSRSKSEFGRSNSMRRVY
jgi:hypothetical protein